MLQHLLLIALLFLTTPSLAANAPDLQDRTRELAAELRCVVCQNLSVADSPSEMAQQMRGIIHEQLQAGKTPQEIKNYFVSKYGEWVLLAPTTKGFSLLVWVLPFVALVVGLGLGVWFVHRWSTGTRESGSKTIDPALLARVRAEAATSRAVELDTEGFSQQSQLEQDRARLYADLKELEFDFQAGKLSEADHAELRQEIETRAAAVLQNLDLQAQAPQVAKAAGHNVRSPAAGVKVGLRGWQLAAGGIFLLLFGLTLGVVLMKSIRPRASEQDSVTGDFLTGTAGASSNNEVATALQEGKAAFGKQDWAKAIESFKKALAIDPNQPEAHAYMGFILIQAGHADGALVAFDKALSVVPNFPMALWGKGMTLYTAKQDYAGAREALEKLLQVMPAGRERAEVEKALTEMPKAGATSPQAQTTSAVKNSAGDHITGKISIDPKLKSNVASQAALFIIARVATGAGGPPLAVKKVDRPNFPLSYSLGPENVMMQGSPFAGKVTISVRLDKDGNPVTRQSGDLVGEYKKNPVDVGSNNVDVVVDQVAQ
jgi:cytochrome c-type biogenesis protein CcmH